MRTLPIVVPAVVLALSACGGAPESSTIDLTFDPCEPLVVEAPEGTAAQRASLADAVAMWRALGATGLDVTPTAGARRIEVWFDEAGPAFHGLYDDVVGTVYINSDLTDHHAAVTIAHELGHAFGLYHVTPDERISVMNQNNITIGPNEGDGEALRLLWGVCPVVPGAVAAQP